MKINNHIDVTEQRHTTTGHGADYVYIDFANGDTIKMAWEHAQAIGKIIGMKQK